MGLNRPKRTVAATLVAGLALVSPLLITPGVATADVLPDLVISEIYAGSNEAASAFVSDFVEIYNHGSSTVQLSGVSLQFSDDGRTWTQVPLAGALLPGGYFVVTGPERGRSGQSLDTVSQLISPELELGSNAGGVALVAGTDLLTCDGDACTAGTGVLDDMFYGSLAGSVLAPAQAAGPSEALSRDAANTRTGVSAADFASATPTVGLPGPQRDTPMIPAGPVIPAVPVIPAGPIVPAGPGTPNVPVGPVLPAPPSVPADGTVGSVAADITRAFTAGSYVNSSYVGNGTSDSAKESALGNLLANSVKAAVAAPQYNATEIGLVDPRAIGSDLLLAPDGIVTAREAAAVMPRNDLLATFVLTGAQFRQLLEEQWQADMSYVQFGLSDNVTYTFDDAAPAGSRIGAVTINGAELDNAATYRIGTYSTLARDSAGFPALGLATDSVATRISDGDALVRYLESKPLVAPDFARHSVQVTGYAGSVTAGESLTFKVAGLNMDSNGAPENSAITVSLEAAEGSGLRPILIASSAIDLGVTPVTDGGAEVSVTIPKSLGGSYRLQVTAIPSGTTVRLPLTIRTAPAAAPGLSAPPTSDSVTPSASPSAAVSIAVAGTHATALKPEARTAAGATDKADGSRLASTGISDATIGLMWVGAILLMLGAGVLAAARRRAATTS
ncbi:5'-nucleotidase C-terminal domain-containing protein [Nakamurella antarctica]|nr:5'-nucleotidase C-terminal domain-containing protein [Nakamurella antarctica]